MVVPYQVWMLQRLAAVFDQAIEQESGHSTMRSWLASFHTGQELFELNDRLADCRVRKEGPRLFSVTKDDA